MKRRGLNLPRPVWLLGWVSFFTDTASEMVYPLLPVFLTRVLGAGAMSLGIIEGVAEAANSGLKIASGWLSDRTRAPKRLVLGGYTLSSAVRPLMAVAGTWPAVLFIRFADRLGKGIRGAPRDAMLAHFADTSTRGLVFGFHRAMDHAGATVGPLLAAAFLYFYPGEYRTLFALTVIPGGIVILVLLRVPGGSGGSRGSRGSRGSGVHSGSGGSGVHSGSGGSAEPRNPVEPKGTPEPREPPEPPEPTQSPLTIPFWKAMAVIFIFTLGNASDSFLLLRLTDLGIAVFWIPLLWSALHVVKSLSSVGGGHLSDRLGRRALIGLGWIVYALVYVGFAVFEAPFAVVAVFLSYGLFFGLTEGVEKAWVADLTPAARRGTAFGIYNGLLGAGSLIASVLFGYLWTRVSPQAAFTTGAALALLATALLYFLFPHRHYEKDPRDQR